EGYDVATADNGRQALQRIADLEPDVVLLDVMMPEMDGWAVLDALEDPKPAVIVITGLAGDREEEYRAAVERGALGYVAKPFDSVTLLELVATAAELDPKERTAFREWLLSDDAD